jgi:hypothetical protein
MKGFLFSADAILALGIIVLAIGATGLAFASPANADLAGFERLASDRAIIDTYYGRAPVIGVEQSDCTSFTQLCACKDYIHVIQAGIQTSKVCVGK